MLKINRMLCTECQICMLICTWFHNGELTTKRSRIAIEGEWPAKPVIHVCLACKDQKCVEACPHDALEWNGWIRFTYENCDGCGACMEVCPVKGIHTDPLSGLPLICDTCQGDFQCVKWCPTQAIERKSKR